MRVTYPWLTNYAKRITEEIGSGHHPHAYLLHGQSGVGKSYLAKALARKAVCESKTDEPLACGRCRSCVLSKEQNHPDIKYLKLEDGASQITVSQSRDLVSFYTLKAHYGDQKIGVILDSDNMNRNAANALLKLVEEPPNKALIIFTTSKIANLPLTLRSRCRKVFIATPEKSLEKEWLNKRHLDDPVVRDPADHMLRGGPIDKLDFLRSEGITPLDMVTTSLYDIFQGNKLVLQSSNAYSGIDPVSFLDCCESVLMFLATLKTGLPPLNVDIPRKQMDELLDICDRIEITKIFSVHDTIAESRKLLASSNGIKTTDIVEEIFFSFSPMD